ncbi:MULTISPECIES: hypothetical protein [Grimontia]|uniref:Uncharacterized protein n=1 Tax=Grimontia marina TaxID=646534 RepID=A0A128F4C5_9GAMM|nr:MULTISPECIES: hypothetical protein [Grimontia]WRV99017.1 hypothetical protein VP504_06245 [Grimontia sp. NTOU-MAR1]CZF81300.1 hypothetical protein GMA8713_01782 [Grimontia marina]
MFETWFDIAVGSLWGFWLVMYLDRFYRRQVMAINLCVFVFWGRSFKANRYLSTFINIVLVVVFLLSASALIGSLVESWGLFIVAWCLGMAVYALCFSMPKPVSRRHDTL